MIYQLFCNLRLDSALNFAGTQAACADVYTFNLTINYCANTLDVRFPCAFCLQMGVADVHTTALTFVADFTYICHAKHLLKTAMFTIHA